MRLTRLMNVQTCSLESDKKGLSVQKSNIHSGPNSKLALKIQTLSRLGLSNILGMYAKKRKSSASSAFLRCFSIRNKNNLNS